MSDKIEKLEQSFVRLTDSLKAKNIKTAEKEITNIYNILSTMKKGNNDHLVDDYKKKLVKYEEQYERLLLTSTTTSTSYGTITIDDDPSIVRLQNSIKLLTETQDVGKQVLNDLNEQRDRIKSINKKLNEVDTHIEESNNILTKMNTWWRKILS